MWKLLKAGLFRLRKSKILYAMIVVTIIVASIKIYVESKDTLPELEIALIDNIGIMSFVIALLISAFVGDDISERSY